LLHERMPRELAGYQPLWITTPFLKQAVSGNGNMLIGACDFDALYIDAEYLDSEALREVLRLAGQGGAGTGGAEQGDLYLRIEIEPHAVFRLEGQHLYINLSITPWEAALGAEVQLSTLSGPVALKVPAGARSGQKLRLRGKGMPSPRGTPGDLYVVVQIQVPGKLSPREKELFEELRQVSHFNPRQGV